MVPHEGEGDPSWRVATRNFYFEAAQSAREYFPDLRVSVFSVDPGEGAVDWHSRLVQFVIDEEVTHVITHIEEDPGPHAGQWTWDVVWTELSKRWTGVLLGVTFDSAYRWLTIQSRRLAYISPNFLLVDICMPMDGVLVPGRPEVGPVNMPMSDLSFAAIDDHTAGLLKTYDVSFIGALYPYRLDLIESLRSQGLSVAVNPHRVDESLNLAERVDSRPSFVDYMAALKQSETTINFSRSSAGPFEQLKTRVIEAASMGCLVLTDDVDRTRRFWTPAEEYAYFASLEEIPGLVTGWLADPSRLRLAQERAQSRARSIAKSSFWGGIEDGLRRRGLRAIRH